MHLILQALFSRNVRAALKELGWTQVQLAEEMGVAPQYVNDYLNHRKSPGLDVLEKFARALDVPADALIAESAIVERMPAAKH